MVSIQRRIFIPMADKIPTRIIQTARNRNLPPLAKASEANLKLLHPNWEYRFFDDNEVNDFVATEFPEYLSIFNGFPRLIQRFDFFRYLAVYRLGGFYFDLDILLWTKLDPLLSSGCVFPFEELTMNGYLRETRGMDWEIGNYAFGASPGHPFMKAIIENCVRAQKEPNWNAPMMAGIPPMFQTDLAVLNTTGPGLITRTLAENLELAQNVNVLFPDDVCDSKSWHQFGNYGVHLMNGSWRDRGSYFRRRFANLWESRRMRKLMPQSIALGKTRSVTDLILNPSF